MDRSAKHACVLVCVVAVSFLCMSIAFAASFITTGDGGWEWQKPTPSGNQWSAVWFVDKNTGWLAGSECVIIKTTDGGRNWAPQGLFTWRGTIGDICFTDKNHGWAVGGGYGDVDRTGLILKTTDGGATWRTTLHGKTDGFRGVCFVNDKVGWAVGGERSKNGLIMKTTDGGETWVAQDCGRPYQGSGSWVFESVCFVDEKTGWLVGNGREIFKTTDGGNTWSVNKPEGAGILKRVQFVDRNTGWVLSRKMLRTTDGGKTWTEHAFGKDDYVRSFHFSDALNGVALAVGGNALRTRDGGKTWSSVAVPQVTGFSPNVYMLDAKEGWAVGDFAIMHTMDGGSTWDPRSSGKEDVAIGVQFVNPKLGWIVGHARTGKDVTGLVMKTEDGGQTWDRKTVPVKAQFSRVCFVDENHGWAAGWAGAIAGTKDGGKTWEVQKSGVKSEFWGLCFVDSKIGWAAGTEGTLIKTTDGGATWSKLDVGTMDDLRGVFFVDQYTGWACGANGRIIRTTDGGRTWKRQICGLATYIGCVFFVDKNTGWAADAKGNIIKTTDGGDIWIAQESGTKQQLAAMHFNNAEEGWLAAGGSDIAHTVDGGQTWAVQNSGMFGTWDVDFTDSNNGWAVCGPLIVRTTTGGLPGIVWAKKQSDGTPANFGHLVVTKKSEGYILAEHPDSRLGIRIKTSDDKPTVGDYIYVHGKVATENGEKIIAADSIDIQCAGWGILPANS